MIDMAIWPFAEKDFHVSIFDLVKKGEESCLHLRESEKRREVRQQQAARGRAVQRQAQRE